MPEKQVWIVNLLQVPFSHFKVEQNRSHIDPFIDL